jgi:hypothetical protein
VKLARNWGSTKLLWRSFALGLSEKRKREREKEKGGTGYCSTHNLLNGLRDSQHH